MAASRPAVGRAIRTLSRIVTTTMLVVVGSAFGAPAALAVPAYAAGSTVCQVEDQRILEGSGLVVRAQGFDVVNDSGDQVQIFHLDRQCRTTSVTTAAIDPRDTEDLAADADGVLYVADIGDNNAVRDSVAVEIVDPAQPEIAQLRRFRYPDGAHDAESLFVQDDGRIVIVTKSLTGHSGVYRSVSALDTTPGGSESPQPLEKIGELTIAMTDTPGGPVGPLGSRLVTGAAASTDGSLIALRTYTDAYIWDLSGADIGGTLVTKPATVVPLPSAPQGEAIAFDPGNDDIYLFGEGEGAAISTLPVTTDPGAAVDNGRETVGQDTASAARAKTRAQVAPYVVIGVIVLGCGALLLVAIRRNGRQHQR